MKSGFLTFVIDCLQLLLCLFAIVPILANIKTPLSVISPCHNEWKSKRAAPWGCLVFFFDSAFLKLDGLNYRGIYAYFPAHLYSQYVGGSVYNINWKKGKIWNCCHSRGNAWMFNNCIMSYYISKLLFSTQYLDAVFISFILFTGWLVT